MDLVSIDDFKKLDLRVAQIKTVEEIPGRDRLYKFSIDIGETAPRTLVAGIKPFYSKEELVGKHIIVVANLLPRALGGVVSQGMLLAVGPKVGPVSLLTLDKPQAPGSKAE